MKQLLKFTAFALLLLVNFSAITAQTGPMSAADRINGLKQRKLLEQQSLLKDVQYRNIGPSVMGGRVVDVDANPADPTEFYIAYASGGLWRTTNNGQSFTPIFDKEDVITIGDIAVNWTIGQIWVGTGEANSSRSSYAGLGVYKSADTGRTWQYCGLPESHHIGKILLHPTDNNTAWVGVLGHLYSSNKERGVFRTNDGGKTWTQTLTLDEHTGVADMDINPANPNEVYATAWYRTRRAWNFEEAGATSALYKSTDGGFSWQLISGGGFPAGPGIGRIGIAVYAANPTIVYACVDNQNLRPDTATKKMDDKNYSLADFKNINQAKFDKLNNQKLDSFLIKNNFPDKYRAQNVKELVRTGKVAPTALYDYLQDANTALTNTPIIGCEVYRSENGGQNWRKVNTTGLNLYNTYGYYFGKISVSPKDDKKVIVSGFNLILSKDGGRTFSVTDKQATHPDWHGCWINPAKDGHWIAANDGGCNITYDYGAHWFKANTPSVGQFYAIETDNAKPYNVYGGLQDNGTWYGASTASSSEDWDYESPSPWKNIGGGDGMQVQVDARDNKTIYCGFQFGYYNRRAADGSRLQLRPQHDLGGEKLRFNWQTPILLSRHNQDVLYYGANKFYRSLNKGEKLEATSSEDLTGGKKEGDVPFGTISTIAESPLRFGLLYVGTDDGNIYVSKDGGYSWVLASALLPKGFWVSRITASAYKESRLYITLNGYRNDDFTAWLFVSNDYGATWQGLGSNLPAEPLNVVKEDPKKEDILYVGSDNGVYASFDMGKTFMSMSHQLPRVPVHDLAIQVRENELVVGTHGRSIYITKLDAVHKAYDARLQPVKKK